MHACYPSWPGSPLADDVKTGNSHDGLLQNMLERISDGATQLHAEIRCTVADDRALALLGFSNEGFKRSITESAARFLQLGRIASEAGPRMI